MLPLRHLESILLPRFTQAKRVGLMCSGGFDSTVMLAACMEMRRWYGLPNHWTMITVPRHDDSVLHADRVREWALKKWKIDLPMLVMGDPDLPHQEQVASGCRAAHDANAADLYILSDTAVPDDLADNAPVRLAAKTSTWVQPWLHMTKDHVVRLMVELDLPEIMELSHTCTESKTIRCGQCWQCRERQWAFGQAGVIDTGGM